MIKIKMVFIKNTPYKKKGEVVEVTEIVSKALKRDGIAVEYKEEI